jgi:hypothetical protein
MATLLFTALGTALGGPLGGALGALAGRNLDSAIFGSGNREGPRLKELSVSTSSYGTPLPRHYGRMRVPGSIIWATELVEHRDREGGGKGKPSITTYSYSASFAVALASRPILDIGRIWADGNLLRGVGGDLKAAGAIRLHTGHGDQAPDPLIAAAEGAENCPAFRGLAYVVFEDLQLGDFGNRIPALTFEVFADTGPLTLDTVLAEVIPDSDAAVPLVGIAGLSCEGPLGNVIEMLDPVIPMDCDASGSQLTISRERLQADPLVLPEAAVAIAEGDFGAGAGFARRRQPPQPHPPRILRYYDVDRDYQPGLQRASGRPAAGQPGTLELPAALAAGDARRLAEAAAARVGWARQSLSWRSCHLDPAVAPGAVVTVPGQPGRWRVNDWEWRDGGVELTLHRLNAGTAEAAAADPGRSNPPRDDQVGVTDIAAFELPWDGAGGGDVPAIFAATSSAGRGWLGAALFVDLGDGNLLPLGPGSRERATLGTMANVLASMSPHLVDRTTEALVDLIDPHMSLSPATPRQLAMGANKALVGCELLQFGIAEPAGGGRWRLRHLLRGRGGTEAAISAHVAEERFVLLDGTATALDATAVGTARSASIVAIGPADPVPAISTIVGAGATLTPLSPVHPRVATLEGGALRLGWTRRARGGWTWLDGVDAPLNEQAERYEVSFGSDDAMLARWECVTAELILDAATLADLAAAAPGGRFQVRQRGTFALSPPLALHQLS